MTIRDRGNIKWTSLMLPEHVKKLRRYIHEEYYDIPEPSLDEQQLEEINELVLEAMEFNLPLTFAVFQNKRLINISGHIHYIDRHKLEFRILSLDNEIKVAHFSKVKGIKKCVEGMDKY